MMQAMAQQQQQQHALQQQGEVLAGDAEFERERKEKRYAVRLLGVRICVWKTVWKLAPGKAHNSGYACQAIPPLSLQLY